MQGITTSPGDGLFVSLADHLAGFKSVQVEFRFGAVQELRLTAPTRRATRARLNAIKDAESFPWEVVALCLPRSRNLQVAAGEAQAEACDYEESFLDQLTPDSAAIVEVTAFSLTFGAGTQKKIEQATLARMTASANSEPSSASSPAVGPSVKSTDGVGPSSSSAPPLPKNPSSLMP